MSSKIKDDISTDKSCVDQYHILAKNSSDKDNEDNNLIIDTEVLPIPADQRPFCQALKLQLGLYLIPLLNHSILIG
jgi:hypothetical protein